MHWDEWKFSKAKAEKNRKKNLSVPQQNENKCSNLENFHKKTKIVILQPHVLQPYLSPTGACFMNCKEKKGFEEGQVGVWVHSHSSTHI